MGFDMYVILACPSHDSDGILELSLESIGVQFDYLDKLQSVKQTMNMDLMIIDPDQPGQDFLRRYRKLHESIGSFPLIVLGPQTHVTMKMIPWSSQKTQFLEGDFMMQNLENALSSRSKELPTKSPTSRTIELFRGIKSIHLADILQMLCQSRWTGEIRVYCKELNQSGVFTITTGHIINAMTSQNAAEDACFEILSWNNCEFHFLENSQSYPREIHSSWEAILIEAATRMDESSHAQVS